MGRKGKKKIRSFSEALKAVDESAQQRSHSLLAALKGDLMPGRQQLENTFHELKDEASKKLHLIRERAVESTRHAAGTVDREAHEKPWIFVGVAALIAAVFGFILGFKSRR